MTRLNLVLLVLLVASALYLVRVSYESRRLFSALDREQTRAGQLDKEHEWLQIQARGQATPLRVEKVARDKLGMRAALPSVIEEVAAPPRAAPGVTR